VIGPDNGSNTLVIINPSGSNSASPAKSPTWATGPHRPRRRRTPLLAAFKNSHLQTEGAPERRFAQVKRFTA
jgi:hypothetical protein